MSYNQWDQYIGKSLEIYGEYCESEVKLLGQLLKPSDVVWEVGANTGSQSVALSRFVHSGKYIGFEPQSELFKLLVFNLAANACSNAQGYCWALGNEDGVTYLPTVDYQRPNNFGALSLLDNPGPSGIPVEIKKGDSLHWLPQPTFLKIDVEGNEENVLRGLQGTIRRQKPVIYVENDRIEKSESLIEFVWSLDYRMYWHITPYFDEENYFANRENIFGRICSFNMLCLPSGNKVVVEEPKITDSKAHPLRGHV